MDPFSGYRDMPHEQVNWAELAQQWMAMKEPEYGVFPAATNLHYEQNNRNLNARPPPPPMNDYRRGPPLTGLSYNDGWRPPPAISEDWRVPPAPHGPPGHFMPHPMGRFSEGSPLQQFMHQPLQQRSFFPAPPRQMGGPPAIPPLMGFNPPPPPTEDEWGFNWQPPPPRMPPPPKPAPPPQALFPSASHKPPPQPLMDQSLRYPPPQPHYSSGPPQHFYHGSNHMEEPAPVPPPPDIPMFSGISDMDDNARKKLPAWIREGLEKSEREKQKQAEKEERIRQAEEEKKKRRELAGKSRFDSDSSDEETDNDGRRDEVQTKFKEELPKLSEEEVREHAMNFIRQFMTTILTEGTDNLLKSTIADARRESVKLEAEPKLLAKSSALAALSSLGGDDDDESERSDDEEPAKTTKTEDFEFKAPIGIPRNFSKSIVERGSVSSPKVQETDEPGDKEAAVSSQRSTGIEENRHKKSRSRSRSPERKRERKRSRSQEKKKRSRSRERKRSRDRKRSRSRERKRDSRRRSRSRESRRHR